MFLHKQSIRQHRLTDVLRRVEDFFIQGTNEYKNRKHFYIVSPPLIIRGSQFFKSKNLFYRIISSLKFGLWNTLLWCPFECLRIQVKRNIRIFGLPADKSIVAKVQGCGKVNNGSGIAREIQIRLKLAKNESLPFQLPEIYAVDKQNGWFIEEYLTGFSPSVINDKDLIFDFLYTQLVDFYRSYLKYEPLNKTLLKLDLSLNTVFWPPEKVAILDQFHKSFWSISLCHNDLSLGNIILSKGKIAVIDWEDAKENPVAFDYENISKSNLILIDFSIRALEKLNQFSELNISDIIPAEIQLAIAAAMKINTFKQRIQAIARNSEITKKERYSLIGRLDNLVKERKRKITYLLDKRELV